jgi:hypothetical protein
MIVSLWAVPQGSSCHHVGSHTLPCSFPAAVAKRLAMIMFMQGTERQTDRALMILHEPIALAIPGISTISWTFQFDEAIN